jgi:RNA polymerase sigma factor (sigma-70 family)
MSTSASPLTDDASLAAQLARQRHSDADIRTAQDALMQLYRRYAPGLLAFLATRVPRSDLEDVHQTVWAQVWEKAPKSFDGRHFRGWLYSIARSRAIDLARRPRMEVAEGIDDIQDRRNTHAAEDMIEDERQAILQRCLEKLSEPMRGLVRGRLGGEDYPALCARLRIAETQQAYKLYFTAVQRLRDCVHKGGP